VLTYVGAYDAKQVGAAIRRELLRDGQVFYVHNRVSSIDRAAQTVRGLVPDARGGRGARADERGPAGAHRRRVLAERVRRAGVHHHRENGLDISNANHADRGALGEPGAVPAAPAARPGRAGRERGYAYFLYPPESPLTETAHDRLATIAQHSELGAGTAVAMKDLEIRGAGNILGAEQSGTSRASVSTCTSGWSARRCRVPPAGWRRGGRGGGAAGRGAVELPVDAHVPHDYVTGERLRLEVYRKIAEAADEAALVAIAGSSPTGTARRRSRCAT